MITTFIPIDKLYMSIILIYITNMEDNIFSDNETTDLKSDKLPVFISSFHDDR